MTKKKKAEEKPNDFFIEIPVFKNSEKKKRPNPDESCPICGGCLWLLGNALKCGWCGEVFEL